MGERSVSRETALDYSQAATSAIVALSCERLSKFGLLKRPAGSQITHWFPVAGRGGMRHHWPASADHDHQGEGHVETPNL
jgi:hypothetical protein